MHKSQYIAPLVFVMKSVVFSGSGNLSVVTLVLRYVGLLLSQFLDELVLV